MKGTVLNTVMAGVKPRKNHTPKNPTAIIAAPMFIPATRRISKMMMPITAIIVLLKFSTPCV